MNNLPYRLLAFTFLIACGTNARAALYIVGTGNGCTHSTIQSAINAADTLGEISTVRITRSLNYTNQHIGIGTEQELTIEGGFATCDQATADTTNTVVSGVGNASYQSVFEITMPTNVAVHLRRLTMREAAS